MTEMEKKGLSDNKIWGAKKLLKEECIARESRIQNLENKNSIQKVKKLS